VRGVVVPRAEQGQVVVGGGAAVGPVADVVGVAAAGADGAAGEGAALVAGFEPAAHRGVGGAAFALPGPDGAVGCDRVDGGQGVAGQPGEGGGGGRGLVDRPEQTAAAQTAAAQTAAAQTAADPPRLVGLVGVEEDLDLQGGGLVAGGEPEQGVGAALLAAALVVGAVAAGLSDGLCKGLTSTLGSYRCSGRKSNDRSSGQLAGHCGGGPAKAG
jgi:hypothetical protein